MMKSDKKMPIKIVLIAMISIVCYRGEKFQKVHYNHQWRMTSFSGGGM